jgi:addiction module RelE/StbE family toxin
MPYRIVPSGRARKDILDIVAYITHDMDSPEAARKLLTDINKHINSLDTMPKRFALVADERLAQKGFRSIPVKKYLIFYVVDEQTETVNIVSVIHNKRNWANLL